MTLQELRFFSIYLAKINARDISTRVVRFPMADFHKIMELGRVNADYLIGVTKNLMKQVVTVPIPNGKSGYSQFQLFKRCNVYQDENIGEWFLEIDAHDEALPLMFEFKDKYFTYELWNALQLRSKNQLRMYELLKQYEHIGERIISLNDLKELLGINANDYPRYGNFKIRVLDSCQEALETYTDIKFTYEPTGKKGSGVKVKAIKFTIMRNENYVDQLSLDNFIDLKNAPDEPFIVETDFKNNRLSFLADACNREFNEAEMQILHGLLIAINPAIENSHFLDGNKYKYETELYDYLRRSYDELNLQASRRTIKSRFGYLKKMLEVANSRK